MKNKELENIEKYAIKDPESFEKTFVDFLENKLHTLNIVKEKLAKGLSVSYDDDKGRWIKEYPNGKKYLLKYDEDTKKILETTEVTD